MQYPAKVLIAWGEAISGNRPLRDWLMKHGYEELGMACHALHHVESSRTWLMANGHQRIMAMIRGAEGDPNAILWLQRFGFNYLADVASGADNDDEAVKRLLKANQKEWAGIALKLRFVKNQLEDDNNDVHRISPV
ncbi:MAG: hypothetical protein OSA37_00075 [Flavobacteriales bacterium]|jgi:hypothetical protein|nr:hypothetical protein [Flavobacteriales bacterium]MDG2208532.1 hypothetical protein [Flavobacteriales bacterium]